MLIGASAQACRLPYELICDGEDRDLGDIRYLLSPQDLAGYAAIPDLIDAGVVALKIEGRLKTPEYVANITAHYRAAIDQAIRCGTVSVSDQAKREMELSFSRGFSSGWLAGNDHKRLVPGLQSSKRGIELGSVIDTAAERIKIKLAAPVALGDGLAIGDQGGRIYSLQDLAGNKVNELPAGQAGWIGFGRGEIDWSTVDIDDTVFKNDDPALNRRLRQSYAGVDPVRRRLIDISVHARPGQPLRLIATTSDGLSAEVVGKETLSEARNRPIDQAILREKLGRLGGTAFELRELEVQIDARPMVPMGMLNRMRRELVQSLLDQTEQPAARNIDRSRGAQLRHPIVDRQQSVTIDFRAATGSSSFSAAERKPQLAVLCRTLEQLQTACQLQVDLVYADFHDIRQYAEAMRIARGQGTPIGLASVRIQKPGEMGLLKAIGRRRPDWLLARNLAAIDYGRRESIPVIADFSLNVCNHLSAQWIRSLGAARVTASYDLNRDQLFDLVESVPPDWLEVVIHQHMPMFHMEHCVFCNVLSPGTNKSNCGRPCDDHVVQLRDRVGAEHTLQADVACRNTLYNATAQSGAETVGQLIQRGTEWLRVELLNEDNHQSQRVLTNYRRLLDGDLKASEVWQDLKAINRLGVTRGTLEPKRNPLAIL